MMTEELYTQIIRPGMMWVLAALLLGVIAELLRGGFRRVRLTPEERREAEKVKHESDLGHR